MTVAPPLGRIPSGRLRRVFVPCLPLTVAVGGALLLLDPGGKGIVGLEVARGVAVANEVIGPGVRGSQILPSFGARLA